MPPPVTVPSCGTCKFWVKENGYGQCHRHAPIPFLGVSCQSAHEHCEADAVYPRTPADEWCGEWVKV